MSAITHRAAVARLKVMEADLRNLVKAIAEGQRLDAMVQLTLGEAAMLISCLEAPDPVTANVHYQSARAAAEAAAYDAFERAGAEPPQPQPVTREEFDQLAATVGDIANTLGRERVVERVAALDALAAAADLAGIPDLAERLTKLEMTSGVDLVGRLSQHSDLLSTMAQIIEGLRRSVSSHDERISQAHERLGLLDGERVVERLSQLEAMTLDKRIDAMRARLDGQRIAGCDPWSLLAAAHALRARIDKLKSGAGGAA